MKQRIVYVIQIQNIYKLSRKNNEYYQFLCESINLSKYSQPIKTVEIYMKNVMNILCENINIIYNIN